WRPGEALMADRLPLARWKPRGGQIVPAGQTQAAMPSGAAKYALSARRPDGGTSASEPECERHDPQPNDEHESSTRHWPPSDPEGHSPVAHRRHARIDRRKGRATLPT